jgi:hypothetical protein
MIPPCPRCGIPSKFSPHTNWEGKPIYLCSTRGCKQGSYYGDSRDIKPVVEPKQRKRK